MASPRREPAHFVVLTCTFEKEGNSVTAQCLELGTTAFGRNLGQAEERLREAILLHLNTLEELGERSRFFKEHNIKIYTKYPEEAHPRIPTRVLSKANVLKVGREFAFA
ncbi:MAG: hypothetical protein U1B78_08070 [Dehalococcoidia bacterium]|nr:hypothetical protein [Dehalococcoidia bacterium]